MPDILIVELKVELEEFSRDTDRMQFNEFELGDIVSEILLFVSDIHFAEMGVESLQTQFRHLHASREGDEDRVFDDGEIMSHAIAKLANAMVQKFKDLNAYLPDGNLPFGFKEWLVQNETPVFTKLLDYKPKIEKEEDEFDPNRWHESRIPDSDPEHVYEGTVVEG